MKFLIISTWRFSLEPILEAMKKHKVTDDSKEIVTQIIKGVEDNPKVHSVGYGGLPNKLGFVELDSALMDGDTLKFGAVGGIRNIKHPILVAKSLLKNDTSNFLVGEGALRYAKSIGLKETNLLTKEAKSKYLKAKKIKGHDTIGAICLNQKGSIAVGTSTSGLFMKEPGRVGDSPVPGSGYYADSNFGAAVATGLGEEIMRRSICYETTLLMSKGLKPQKAVDQVMKSFICALKLRKQKIRSFSLVALNKKGEWGVATNDKHFSFVVYTDKQAKVYNATYKNNKTVYQLATKDWIKSHIE